MSKSNTENNRSYRIKADVGNENGHVLTFNINQDIDILEILSLKIETKNAYLLQTANYGCIAGRVLANGGVGIPNAKISVFIGADEGTKMDETLNLLYPYSSVNSKNEDGVRYNLLPNTEVSVCHTPVGTFPSKREILDDNNENKLFDKYYTFTTRTNDSGDYMLFGVPVGTQILHTDIDLSDIGFLSQRPRDMIFKGYNITQFENANKFKYDTNLDDLTQIISQNDSVYVSPFWGEEESGEEIKITRNDINVQYKFEPTCVFIGSVITDERSQGVNKECRATDRMGKMDRITTGSGTIEMIRRTPSGGIESKSIQGNQLIDGNGTWCYQIPMNLDYYMTDEYGNLVPSDDTEKGIPTRTRVRFRVSLNDFQSDYENNHIAKVLIPNNPKKEEEIDYHFGSLTEDSDSGDKSFRDLFWNNVYTVKSYIPRIQKGNGNREKRFTGIKQVNVNGSNNPIPYNNLRVNLSFMFTLQCAILKIMIKLTYIVNLIKGWFSSKKCSYLGEGVCPDLENWYFAPGCKSVSSYLLPYVGDNDDNTDSHSVDAQNKDYTGQQPICATSRIDYLMQCVEINLAMEYEVIQFDFYNDWINGMVYIPRWFMHYRRKRTYLFGLIKVNPKIQGCMEDSYAARRRFVQQCALTYEYDEQTKNYSKVNNPNGCAPGTGAQKCHKAHGRKYAWVLGKGGLVHKEDTILGQKAYYFKPAEWVTLANKEKHRCLLFATDIVLLGSLNDYDKHGIPKAFEELVSSTYLMPTNLASTNMDSEQYMLGTQGTEGGNPLGGFCKGRHATNDSMEPQPQTFESYVKWTKNSDMYESAPDDPSEYAVTESAGIDWGYSGPNQGGTNLSKLYYPGGHFLGIGCANSEVNIKSCVNLSRICEIGSMMSQRQLLVTKDGNGENRNFKYSYLIPSGLINKYDINDSSFRKAFATLNYNGLKTKKDLETGYPTYDIKPLTPNAFNGELRDKVSNDTYNSRKINDDETGQHQGDAYHSVIETNSQDYYRFRFGVHDFKGGEDYNTDEEKYKKLLRQRYLINERNYVSIPVYENSYYFYFGLKDGNTAIDRFFKDFYAKCDTNDEDMTYFTVNTSGNAELCADNNGTAEVTVHAIDSPFMISLTKDGVLQPIKVVTNNGKCSVVVDNQVSATTVYHSYDNFTLSGLSHGAYSLIMGSEDTNPTVGNFVVENYVDGPASATTTTFTDFKDYANNDSNAPDEDDANAWASRTDVSVFDGYITINNTQISGLSNVYCYIVTNENYYEFVTTTNNPTSVKEEILANTKDTIIRSITDVCNLSGKEDVLTGAWVYSSHVISGNSINVAAWEWNCNYEVLMIVNCGNVGTSTYKAISIGSGMVYMNEGLDLMVGDYITLRKLQKTTGVVPTETGYDNIWVTNVIRKLTDNNTQPKTKANIIALLNEILYRDSMYSSESYQSIYATPIGGEAPYTTTVKAYPERSYTDGELLVRTLYTQAMTNDEISQNIPVDSDDYYIDMNSFMFPTAVFNNGELLSLSNENYTTAEERRNRSLDVVINGQINRGQIYGGDMKFGQNIFSNHKTFIIKTKDTNNTELSATLPSIYKPFFFNAFVLCLDGETPQKIDTSGDDENVGNITFLSIRVNVVNPINDFKVQVDVRNSSGEDVINSESVSISEVTLNTNDYDKILNGRYFIYDKNLHIRARLNNNKQIQDGFVDVTITVTEKAPNDGDNEYNGRQLKKQRSVRFPYAKEVTLPTPPPSEPIHYWYTELGNSKLFGIGSNNVEHEGTVSELSSELYNYASSGTTLNYDYTNFNENGTWDGIFKDISIINTRADYLKEITQNVNPNARLCDCTYTVCDYMKYHQDTGWLQNGIVSYVKNTGVIAISDNWTDYGGIQESQGSTNWGYPQNRVDYMLRNYIPDTNILSIARYYNFAVDPPQE